MGRTGAVVGDVVGSVALAMLGVGSAVAYAALIFTGPAAGGLPRGAANFILCSAIVMVFFAWRSRFPVVVAGAQDTAAIVLATASGIVVTSGSDDPARDVTVIVALSSGATGVAMLAMGRARLGSMARYMPTTVVAGFLAGAGYLLAKGGFDVMTRRSLGLSDLGDLAQTDLAKQWAPGLVLGLVIVGVPFVKRLSPAVSSLVLVAMVAAFSVIVRLRSSLAAVEAGGWLVGPFPDGESIRPLSPSEVTETSWPVLGGASGSIAVVIILSIVGLLLNVSGLQLLQRRRVDLDDELTTAGVVNVIIAPLGGAVGYHLLGASALAGRIGVVRRGWVMVTGAIVAAVAVVGGDLVGYLPRFVAGGLLLGSGLGLLLDWVTGLRATASPSDRAVSMSILACVVFFGILEGIVLGVVLACVFFAVRYSRIDPVRLHSNGVNRRSVVERSPAQDAVLDDVGDRLAVIELHGYMFFGSISSVAEEVREHCADVATDVVIIDFGRVTGVDASAFSALAGLLEELGDERINVLLSGLDTSSQAALLRSSDDSLEIVMVVDLDTALEAAESALLAEARSEVDSDEVVRTGIDALSDELVARFTTSVVQSGEALTRQGDPSDAILLIQRGGVTASLVNEEGKDVRLRTLRAGAIIGEMGVLTGRPRTATVVANGDVVVASLTVDDLAQLRLDRPDLALELYDYVLRGTAERAAAIHDSLAQATR